MNRINSLEAAIEFIDDMGISLVTWVGGWRIDLLDPRLEPGMPMYDAELHARWEAAGHRGSWVHFYGITPILAASKATDWLRRHPDLMEIKHVLRQTEKSFPLPDDKFID